ncbi:hypothetical protein C672_3595 [[Clostridium] bifermentans ATCC 638]|uniref:Uncharacterized protein n=1 Tax=Paraclostridium bifermentans ATCC 638 = DSM 14991 TaxID=1233171 RepID=T4V7P0_PARBF|nr:MULTISPECIES: hypothetical protein [Clostridiaceae]EQK39739.1 hypothetical protein C672_3595 [[Clostridium] bifermentans ATCC 638] [Paraclostridium bifermentans ATCC 638 = DSM 14991]RIZ57424.1 hypothetical protein CHH45_16435 [Paraclostridium bifermentans]
MNKIYILEGKNGEVLAILSNREDKTYSQFREECTEAAEESNNDFYSVKDILVSMYGYEVVDVVGGFETNKKKGAI